MSKSLCLNLVAYFALSYFQGQAQDQPLQSISGEVVDKTSHQPLTGANVFINVGDKVIGAATDTMGRFILNNVPPGRHQVHCTNVNYEPWLSSYLEVTSAKQLFINVEMIEASIVGEAVIVKANRSPSEASNEYGLNGVRSFTAEETQRFAGSINDPGRMALSLPGVQVSSQDNENTMAVRANSPIGLSWRLEGVEIPNPNHFAEVGSSGGGISALSVYVLGASDFFTGAFPPEYGNATAGVMDLKFRKGNHDEREYRLQAGIIGLDFASEGPLSRKKKSSSYLFNYRYSTLGLLSSMGINIANPLTSNTFQDLSFNLDFPISKKTRLTFFGFGGLSSELKSHEKDTAKWESYNEASSYEFYTKVGVAGVTLTHLLGENAYIYGVVSTGANHIEEHDDTLNYAFQKFRVQNEHHLAGRVNTAWSYNTKLGRAIDLKAGFQGSILFYDVFREDYDKVINRLRPQVSGSNNTFLVQPYAVVRALVTPGLTVQGGFNSMYLGFTRQLLVEPRAGALFTIGKMNLALSYGMHSQILPFQVYEAVTTDSLTGAIGGKPNANLSMWRAHHVALSIAKPFKGNVRLKIEPYFQFLFDVPVSIHPWSTYSLINQDRNYSADTLSNVGTGHNAGIELTLEKTFVNRLFFLFSCAVYDSKYSMNNGGRDVSYNTKYNSNVNAALTFGKEWDLKRGRRLEIGGRILYGGGMPYTPYNTQASIETGRPVYIQDQAYSQRVSDYFRIDTRIALRKNREGFSSRWSLDIQNLTDRANPQRPYFDRWTGHAAYAYNTSIVPVISYMIDF
jgi:hypothetical protein